MAYVPEQKLDDPNQQQAPQATASTGAPTVSAPSLGSTPSFGGSAGNTGSGGLGAQGIAQQQQGQGSAPGTGFVNIDRVLNANQNAGQDQQAEANKQRGTETANFNTAKNTANSQIAAQGGSVDVNNIVNGIAGSSGVTPPTGPASMSSPSAANRSTGTMGAFSLGGTQPAAPTRSAQTSTMSQAGAVKAATDVLGKQYNGPTSLNYDVGNTKEAQALAGLGNANTAGQTLAARQGPLAAYNPGLSAIDAAIYGSQQNLGTQSGITAANTAQLASEKQGAADVANNAKSMQGQIQNNKTALTSALGTRAALIQSGADAKAKAAMAQEAADRAQGIIRDPNTGKVVQSGYKGQVLNPTGWEAGTGNATGQQFLSGGDISGLNAIGKLIGDQGLATEQAGPAWVSGRNTTINANPIGSVSQYVPLTPVNTDTSNKSGSAQPNSPVALRRLNPDGTLAG